LSRSVRGGPVRHLNDTQVNNLRYMRSYVPLPNKIVLIVSNMIVASSATLWFLM
jgi:hypothetical protein